MFKLKNQAGFSDAITMLILGSIIAVLFIASVFIWRETEIYQNVDTFLTSISNKFSNKSHKQEIKTFEECLAANNLVLESYPRQCVDSQGQVFVEDLGEAIVDLTMVKVSQPQVGQLIDTPLIIKGQAKGTWFFEGDFPIILTDDQGLELGLAIASAQGEWMTEEFVDFEAEIDFKESDTDIGFLVFKKDNPSGLPEHDDSFSLPIFFKK